MPDTALIRGLRIAAAAAGAVGLATVVGASLPPVTAPASMPNLIRCPDWQNYVPVIARPSASEQQTAPRFAARTTDTITTTPLADTTRKAPPAAVSRVPTGSRSDACTHSIRAGDTYSRIAEQQLGDPKRWREIAQLNPRVKPEVLKVGQTIKMPCAAAGSQVATGDSPAAMPQKPQRRGWWIFGGNRQSRATSNPTNPRTGPTASQNQRQQEARTEPTAGGLRAAKPPAPPSVILPLWTAKKDEFLADIIKRWGKDAGYTVIVATTDAWQLSVPIRLRAEFEDAVDELIAGLAHDGTPPRVRIYPNAVLRLGGPL